MFGSDFFKILEFVHAILRLFGRIFGDDDDKKNDDKVQSNCKHEVVKIIDQNKNFAGKSGTDKV